MPIPSTHITLSTAKTLPRIPGGNSVGASFEISPSMATASARIPVLEFISDLANSRQLSPAWARSSS